MYRVNPLPRKTVIVTDEVIKMGPVSNNPDVNVLMNAIIVAEERYLKQAMGSRFYYDFRDKKNRLVTEENKDELESKVNEGNTGEAIELEVGDIVNAIEFVGHEFYKQWWFEFGWAIAAEAVVLIATPQNWLRHEASGEMINNPKTISMDSGGKGSQSGEIKDVQWKMKKAEQDRIDPLIAASHAWLCENRSYFELYDKPCDCDGNNGISVKRKTAWVHGVYEDLEGRGCCK